MSDESRTPPTLTALAKLLQEARALATQPKEPTFFSLGGRGHYENPASDLLGFFLNPRAQHGLDTLFLKSFFDCIGVSHGPLNLKDARVSREVRTVEGKSIDLLIQGQDWALVIENKIHHIQSNPFESYEAHVQSLYGGQSYFAILSPDGTSVLPDKWKPVSYKTYCAALRKSFGSAMFDLPFSKWMVFAREFVLHFENELYSPTMTHEQLKFVERNLPGIEQVKSMSKEYTGWLTSEFQKGLNEALPTHRFTVFDDGFALRANVEPERWLLALQTPATTQGNPDRKFRLIVYSCGLTPEQDQQAAKVLGPMTRGREGKWTFWYRNGPNDSGESINEMCLMARQLAEIWSVPTPVPQ